MKPGYRLNSVVFKAKAKLLKQRDPSNTVA